MHGPLLRELDLHPQDNLNDPLTLAHQFAQAEFKQAA